MDGLRLRRCCRLLSAIPHASFLLAVDVASLGGEKDWTRGRTQRRQRCTRCVWDVLWLWCWCQVRVCWRHSYEVMMWLGCLLPSGCKGARRCFRVAAFVSWSNAFSHPLLSSPACPRQAYKHGTALYASVNTAHWDIWHCCQGDKQGGRSAKDDEHICFPFFA